MNKAESGDVQRHAGRKGRRPSSDADDQAQIAAFLAGDADAFGVLFRRYRQDVYDIAYRYTNNADDALEITQEVFMKVCEGLKDFRRGSRFFTWIYRIAVNQSIDFMRRRKRRSAVPLQEELWQAAGAESDPVQRAEERELRERLHSAVQELSERHRTVLILHALEKLSYAEIARIVGCSIGTVMSRLFYARKRLAELLGQDRPQENRSE